MLLLNSSAPDKHRSWTSPGQAWQATGHVSRPCPDRLVGSLAQLKVPESLSMVIEGHRKGGMGSCLLHLCSGNDMHPTSSVYWSLG